ncbi:hypothetical protein BU17DRAFT_65335 [Hysterangium stoloniferum]|nr:hypothetical protein BU17DRAFT_65335 [Hysterangium stoloniferum]
MPTPTSSPTPHEDNSNVGRPIPRPFSDPTTSVRETGLSRGCVSSGKQQVARASVQVNHIPMTPKIFEPSWSLSSVVSGSSGSPVITTSALTSATSTPRQSFPIDIVVNPTPRPTSPETPSRDKSSNNDRTRDTGEFVRDAALEAQRQKELFQKLPEHSYSNVRQLPRTRSGLSQLFRPNPRLFPQGHRPPLAMTAVTKRTSIVEPVEAAVNVSSVKSTATMPVTIHLSFPEPEPIRSPRTVLRNIISKELDEELQRNLVRERSQNQVQGRPPRAPGSILPGPWRGLNPLRSDKNADSQVASTTDRSFSTERTKSWAGDYHASGW